MSRILSVPVPSRPGKSLYTMGALLVLTLVAACGDSGTAPARTVASVVVSPSQQALVVGEEKSYEARALDAAGRDIEGRAIAWSSNDATVATVSATGLVTALAPGNTVITATVDGRTGSGALQVALAPVATVVIDPATVTIVEGETRPLTLTAKDAAGRPLEGRTVTWTSSNAAAATVSTAGVMTAVAPGTAVIRASVEGKVAEAAVTVAAAVVASVEPSATTLTLEEGDSRTLTAIARDAAGRALSGRVFSWSSDAAAIASVNAAGRITALGTGRTNLTVTAEGRSATIVVTVTPAAVASVAVTPGAVVLEIGEARQMQAVVKDARGGVLQGRAVQWSITGTNAIVSPSGVVTGLRNGYVTINATVEGVAGGVAATITTGEPYAWDLIYNKPYPSGNSEIFILGVGTGTAPWKLNAGNVSRAATPSPSGNRIAFAVSMQDLTTREWINDIFAVDRNGMNMKQLTKAAGHEIEPAWSPAGGRIAFTHYDTSGRSDIWVMNEDGSGAVNLTADMPLDASRNGAAWSPDGSRIAFRQTESGSAGTTTSIFTMRADGSAKQVVTQTTTGFDSRPNWSPNGQLLAFSRYYAGDADITLVPATGGATQRIAMPGLQSMPSWSPDGSMIAFQQYDTGRQNVYTMAPDGSRVRLRTVDPAWGGGVAPAWIRKP